MILLYEGISTGTDLSVYISPLTILQSAYTYVVQLGGFINCSTISSARELLLGVVVRNIEGDDVDDGVAGVLFDGFVAGVCLSSLSYYSIVTGVNDDVSVVLLMLGDGI